MQAEFVKGRLVVTATDLADQISLREYFKAGSELGAWPEHIVTGMGKVEATLSLHWSADWDLVLDASKRACEILEK
jgi:hypothetical protein